MAEETKLPPEEEPVLPPVQEHKLIDELQKMEYEELLPVEKKLISWSIIISIVSLGFLVWLSHTFFPAGHSLLRMAKEGRGREALVSPPLKTINH